MTLETLAGRGFALREIARKLGVSEGAVRYQLRRRSQGFVDGRSRQQFLASGYRGAIDAYLDALGQESPENVADLFEFLLREHDYSGSMRIAQLTGGEEPLLSSWQLRVPPLYLMSAAARARARHP